MSYIVQLCDGLAFHLFTPNPKQLSIISQAPSTTSIFFKASSAVMNISGDYASVPSADMNRRSVHRRFHGSSRDRSKRRSVHRRFHVCWTGFRLNMLWIILISIALTDHSSDAFALLFDYTVCMHSTSYVLILQVLCVYRAFFVNLYSHGYIT
uniref:Uncharacterized protein n=1 Tax=Helianthus annuus TaxID=4232 RepID=A0A251RRW6_HELAN